MFPLHSASTPTPTETVGLRYAARGVADATTSAVVGLLVLGALVVLALAVSYRRL